MKKIDSKTNKTIKRELVGEVIKISGKNSVKVEVETKFAHPIYEKILKSHKKYLIHVSDEMQEKIKVGDSVVMQECKPISKKKNFILVSKIEKK